MCGQDTPATGDCPLVTQTEHGFPYLGSARASSVRRRAPAREGRASTPSRSKAATRSAMVAWAAGLSRHKHGARRLRPFSGESGLWDLRSESARLSTAPATPHHAIPRPLPTEPCLLTRSRLERPAGSSTQGSDLILAATSCLGARVCVRLPAKLPRPVPSDSQALTFLRQAWYGERGRKGEGDIVTILSFSILSQLTYLL